MLGMNRLALTDLIKEYCRSSPSLDKEKKEVWHDFAGKNAMFTYFLAPVTMIAAFGIMVYYSLHYLGNSVIQAVVLSSITIIILYVMFYFADKFFFRAGSGGPDEKLIYDFKKWIESSDNKKHEKYLFRLREHFSNNDVKTQKDIINAARSMDKKRSILKL